MARLATYDDWSEDQRIKVIIAVGEAGYNVNPHTGEPDDLDIDLCEMDSFGDLAYHFADEGLLGDIPARIQCYLNYDAIARDLGWTMVKLQSRGNT